MIDLLKMNCTQTETAEWVKEWREFYPALDKACARGDLDLAQELIRSHPERWEELDEDYLDDLLDSVLLRRSSVVRDEEEMQSGKKEIFFLIVSHRNWNPTDLRNLLSPLVIPKHFTFDQEESFQLVCAFFKVNRLEEISVGMLAELTKALLICEPRGFVGDLFQKVTTLPNWNRIPPYAYKKIIHQIHFPYRTIEELEILFSHPHGDLLADVDRVQVINQCEDREDLLAWLEKKGIIAREF